MGEPTTERATPEPERFFFVHLQKTAGTTLGERLRRHFEPAATYPGPGDGTPPDTTILVERVVERFAVRRDEIRLVIGHFPLCTTELLGVPFTTFTVLRHPVDRILSALRSQHQKDPRMRHTPLEQIYDDPMRHAMLRNHMVKMFSLETHEMTAGALSEVAFTPARLTRAKERLAGVDEVGLQEDFEGFCARLVERYGWHLGRPLTANPTEPMDAPSSLEARIAEDNADDLALYEFARTLVPA